MRYVKIFTLGYFLFFGGYCHAEASSDRSYMNITSYYLNAEDQSRSPPPEESLRIVCQKKQKANGYITKDHYITFIGVEDQKVLLFALTDKKMRDARKSIYLTTRIFTEPTIRISGGGPGVTQDWGYVFDRNQDGLVDYLAFMLGPLPVAPIGYKKDLPNLSDSKLQMTLGTVAKIYVPNSPLAYWHVADDNSDGSVDGFAKRALSLDNGWSYGWIVVKSSAFNNTFDKCRYYSEHDKNKSYLCEPTEEGHSYIVSDKHKASSMPIEIYDEWLLAVNSAIKECKLDATYFYTLPDTFRISEKAKRSTDWSEDDFYE